MIHNLSKQLFFLSTIFISSCALAQDDYSLRLYHGKVTSSNFTQIIGGKTSSGNDDLRVTSLDAGYLLAPSFYDLPIDIYIKSGFSYFDEANTQSDIYELTLYLKVYWNIDLLENRFRLGIGDGISYTSDILTWEYEESIDRDDKNSKVLNYLDVSIDFDVGKLLGYKPLDEIYFGWAIKHRSGINGTFGGVQHSGSNYTGFYIESNF